MRECLYVRYVPFRCFGQHTNSTPANRDIPQGSSIAKLLRFMFLSLQVSAAVAFHLKQRFFLFFLHSSALSPVSLFSPLAPGASSLDSRSIRTLSAGIRVNGDALTRNGNRDFNHHLSSAAGSITFPYRPFTVEHRTVTYYAKKRRTVTITVPKNRACDTQRDSPCYPAIFR